MSQSLVPEKNPIFICFKKSIRNFLKDAIAFSTRLIFLKIHIYIFTYFPKNMNYSVYSFVSSNILGGSLIKQASLQGQKSSNNMEILQTHYSLQNITVNFVYSNYIILKFSVNAFCYWKYLCLPKSYVPYSRLFNPRVKIFFTILNSGF